MGETFNAAKVLRACEDYTRKTLKELKASETVVDILIPSDDQSTEMRYLKFTPEQCKGIPDITFKQDTVKNGVVIWTAETKTTTSGIEKISKDCVPFQLVLDYSSVVLKSLLEKDVQTYSSVSIYNTVRLHSFFKQANSNKVKAIFYITATFVVFESLSPALLCMNDNS